MDVSDQACGMSGVVATPSSMFAVAVPLTDVFGGLSLLPVSPMAARLTDCDAFEFDEIAVTNSEFALVLSTMTAPLVVFDFLPLHSKTQEQTLRHAA